MTQMTDAEEKIYMEGGESTARLIMIELFKHLPDGAKSEARWQIERAETVIKLRGLARELGVEWTEELYLPDNIDRIIATLADKRVL